MPVKEADVRRDYGFDYSAELGTDTITASTWTADDGLTLTGETFDTTKTSVFIEGGIEGQTLTATNRVTTFATRTYERVLTLIIRAAVDIDDDARLIAVDVVAELAPAPIPLPVPDTYSPRAARAERTVAGYILATDSGAVKSSSLSGVASETYAGFEAVQGIVARIMGSYYKEAVSAESSNTAFVGYTPW